MNGLARVLHRRESQDRHLARIGIDFDVHDVAGERATHATRIHGAAAHDRPAGLIQFAGELLERERFVPCAKNAALHSDGRRVGLP